MISYKAGYKYQLATDYEVAIPLHPAVEIDVDFIRLSAAGGLLIRKGYAWDGPSGPTFDTANFMRGAADNLLRAMCIEDGMSALRACWVWKGVRWGGKGAVGKPKEVITAP